MWPTVSRATIDGSMTSSPSTGTRRFRLVFQGSSELTVINAATGARLLPGDGIELVPRADVVELPDVGYYPRLEAPERVLAAVLQHFERS